jgi:hypothetical protein
VRSCVSTGGIDVPGRGDLPWPFVSLIAGVRVIGSVVKVVGNQRDEFIVGNPLVFLADSFGLVSPTVLAADAMVELFKQLRRPTQFDHTVENTSLCNVQVKVEGWF